MRKLHLSRKQWTIIGAVVFAIAFYGMFLPFPLHYASQNRSLVWLECRYCFALTAPGCDTLYFNGLDSDTTLNSTGTDRTNVENMVRGNGFWYSPTFLIHHCNGRIMTATEVVMPDTSLKKLQSLLPLILTRQQEKMSQEAGDVEASAKQLAYYMNTHGVMDEGFNQVALYNQQFKKKQQAFEKTYSALLKLANVPDVKVEYLPVITYRATLGGDTLQKQSQSCKIDTISHTRGIAILRTASKSTPLRCISLSKHIFNGMSFTSEQSPKSVLMLSYNMTSAKSAEGPIKLNEVKGRAWKEAGNSRYASSLPILQCAVGAPVVDGRGVLIGIAVQNGIIPIK